MFLFETKYFFDNKMFGKGNMSNYAFDNLGEYISLYKSSIYLINTFL